MTIQLKGHPGEIPLLRATAIGLHLRQGEVVSVTILGLLVAAMLVLLAARGQAVAWSDFTLGYMACGFLLGLGLVVRSRAMGGAVWLELVAQLVIAVGVYSAFGTTAAIFIHALFPMVHPSVDHILQNIDARLGYSWPALVHGLAEWPLVGQALGQVYHSSFWQLFALIVVLVLLRRPEQVHRMIVVGMLSLILTTAVWWLFPSFGPSAFYTVPPEVASRINLVVDNRYGTELLRMASEGNATISLEIMKGVIAFPSYHMIMACMVVWFSHRTPAFRLFLPINLVMILATLSHGGHYLVDLISAVAMFALVVWISGRFMPPPGRPGQTA